MTAFDNLAHPPVEGLCREDCEFLAYEDSRIAAAVNARATALFLTYQGTAAFAIAELQELARRIQASATTYRQAQQQTPNTPRWPQP